MSASDPLPDERLADWVDGRMSDREQERFRAELRVNAQLRADLAAYEATVAAVRAALQAPTRPSAMADRVLAAIAAQPASPAAAPSSRRLYWSLLSAAALLSLAFLLNAWPAGETPTVASEMAKATPAPTTRPIVAEGWQDGARLAGRYGGGGNGNSGAAQAASPIASAGLAAPAATSDTTPGDPAVAGDLPKSGADAALADAGRAEAKAAAPAPAAPAAKAAPAAIPFLELDVVGASVEPSPPAGDDASTGRPLGGDALRAAVAAFLARAADPAADAAVATWTTANGDVTASPWLDADARDDAATTRAWIVEGPKDEVALLLAAASAFARARDGVVRNGETPAPATGDGKPATAASARLVLRVKLRRRQ